MKRRFLLSILLIFFLNAVAQAQPKDTLAPLSLDHLLDSIQTLMEKQHIPGLMLTLVARDSVIYDQGLGMAHLEEERPVDARQRFRLGSISKSFAALCILKLEAEGKFSLQDKLKDVAPEIPFTNQWEKTDPVRIVHLLEHTSGFDDMHFKAMYNWKSEELPVMEAVKLHSNSLKTRWKPGTRFSYANPGYVVLTYLVEKYAGMSYHDYVARAIFEPLDMQYSDFTSFPDDFSGYAQGYAYTRDVFRPVPFYAVNAGMAGALNACGRDMARFLRLFLNDGKMEGRHVVSPELIRRMETPTSSIAAQKGLYTAYALANRPAFLNAAHFFRGHDGGIDGFTSSYGYCRELGVGFAISNNANQGMGEIAGLIVKYLRQYADSDRAKNEPLAASSDLSSYEGYYDFRSPRNQIAYNSERLFAGIDLQVRKDTLLLKRFGQPDIKYISMGKGLFRPEKSFHPTLVLTKDESGKPVAAGNLGYFEKGSTAGIWMQRIFLVAAQFLVVTFVLFGLIWLIVRIFDKYKSPAMPVVTSFFLSSLGFWTISVAFVLLTGDLRDAGQFNSKTLAIFFGSLLFAGAAFAGLLWLLARFNSIRSLPLKIYLVAAGLSLAGMAIYLAEYGWIGLRLWAY